MKRGTRYAMVVCIAVAVVLAAVAAYRVNVAGARAAATRGASARAQTAAGLIASELQKFRLLPVVLSDYPDVQNALSARTPEAIARLDARLEMIARRTNAAVIYVVGADGRTVGSSNWRLPSSFVGQDYRFRPYFRQALAHGAAEQFALGTVSRRAGLYLARRAANGEGVIVVKVEFDGIQAAWSHQSGPTLVRDGNGVVILSNRPAWRLRATRSLSNAARARITAARLYGDRPPPPLAPDLTLDAGPIGMARRGDAYRYATATVPIPVSGWSLTALEPLQPAMAAASARMWIAALAAAIVALVVLGLVVRAREGRALRVAAQRRLENEVTLRTAELSEANQQLLRESRERERNEARLRTAREELAQSNRLATLGQISAGVAHEINQPLAALRTFAENAAIMLGQQRVDAAAANLDHIVGLSTRIGDITGELRSFARREVTSGPVRLGQAIDGTLLLTGDRLRQIGVRVCRRGEGDDLMVAADRVRVEQILINLIQNATDALSGRPSPTITIGTVVREGIVEIELSDNGAGIAPAMRRRLFTSFATDKTGGLGLGLVISRDLAREVGGELTDEPGSEHGGATFLLCLPLA